MEPDSRSVPVGKGRNFVQKSARIQIPYPLREHAVLNVFGASRAPEDAELADAVDALGKPDAATISAILTKVGQDFGGSQRDRRNRRKIPHRLEECGYVPVRNPTASDGYWVVSRKRVPIYAKREMSLRHQISAAERLAR